jgi:hypothetical protein
VTLLGAACARPASYYKDVKPILDEKCANCHVSGGIAPFPLTDPNDVLANKTLIRAAVAGRVMPPWMADNGCADYSNDRSLSDTQIHTITSWIDSGAPLGSASDAPPETPRTGGLSHVDIKLPVSAPYTPRITPDEYRCYLLDWPKTQTSYVTGFGITPGDARIVHHVVAFIIPPDQAAAYQQLDDSDPLPGYSCFGGPGILKGIPSLLGVWAPGSTGIEFPAGTGIQMVPGSKVVLQVHYNTLSNPPAPDQSTLSVEVADSVEKQSVIMPFTNPTWLTNRDMLIHAGDPDAIYSFSFDVSQALSAFSSSALNDGLPFTIYMGGLHMHWLGTHVKTWIQRSSGENTCLVDIPQWNFNWQSAFDFNHPTTFNPGDTLNLECHWNNTAANQPVVNGEQRPAKDVNWGEDSTDEMCMAFFYVSQ